MFYLKLNAYEKDFECLGNEAGAWRGKTSSLCGEGEQLYTCVTIWQGGASTSGSVCATSRAMAKTSLNLAYHAQFVK